MIQEFKNEILDTYENTMKKYGDFEIPVPTYYMGRDMDFSILVSLLLRSKLKKQGSYRYINYSYIDKDAICNECKISKKTLYRKLKYLEEINILTPKNTENGLIYIINYCKDGKHYVTIHHRILMRLIRDTNKYAIKLYILLKMQCDIFNNNPMSNAYLCKQLGYSTSSKRNLEKVGSMANLLVKHGFIEKTQNRIHCKDKDGKMVKVRVDTYYRLNGIENFK